MFTGAHTKVAIKNARTEGVSQRGEQQVEGAGKFKQFMISDFGFTINV